MHDCSCGTGYDYIDKVDPKQCWGKPFFSIFLKIVWGLAGLAYVMVAVMLVTVLVVMIVTFMRSSGWPLFNSHEYF